MIWQENGEADSRWRMQAELLELLQASDLECTWAREMECEQAQKQGHLQVDNLVDFWKI